jgi:hypothetical protein
VSLQGLLFALRTAFVSLSVRRLTQPIDVYNYPERPTPQKRGGLRAAKRRGSTRLDLGESHVRLQIIALQRTEEDVDVVERAVWSPRMGAAECRGSRREQGT